MLLLLNPFFFLYQVVCKRFFPAHIVIAIHELDSRPFRPLPTVPSVPLVVTPRARGRAGAARAAP